MVVLGAFIADIFYGSIAFFGIAPFLEKENVMAVFWLAGGLILTVLGIVSIRHSLRNEEISYTPDHLKKKRWAFLGGLSLSAANPMMILWWLSGVRIFKDIGLITRFYYGYRRLIPCSRKPRSCVLSCGAFSFPLLGQEIYLFARSTKDQFVLRDFSHPDSNILRLYFSPCTFAYLLTL